jgi:hypothetical protein
VRIRLQIDPARVSVGCTGRIEICIRMAPHRVELVYKLRCCLSVLANSDGSVNGAEH